jgi:hypothetical protein
MTRSFAKEFKVYAVKLVMEGRRREEKLSLKQTVRPLDISPKTLHK